MTNKDTLTKRIEKEVNKTVEYINSILFKMKMYIIQLYENEKSLKLIGRTQAIE